MMADRTSSSPWEKLTIETALSDGTLVRMRPVQPEDRHLLEVGMDHLSSESRYFRFFSPVSELSESMLCRFTEIDHVNHEAVGVLDIGTPPGTPVGVARYIRAPEQKTAAEVALTVADSHQGKGIGTLMLAYLAQRATDNGIREFTAIVLRDNHRMRDIFRELGATMKRAAAGEVNIRFPLFTDPAQYPQTPVGDVFRQVSALMAVKPGPGDIR